MPLLFANPKDRFSSVEAHICHDYVLAINSVHLEQFLCSLSHIVES